MIYAYIRIQIIVEIKTIIVVPVRILPVRVLPVRVLPIRVLLVRVLLVHSSPVQSAKYHMPREIVCYVFVSCVMYFHLAA